MPGGAAAQRDLQMMQSAFAQLGAVMRKQREDEEYNKILDSLEPGIKHRGGRAQFEAYSRGQDVEQDAEAERLNNLMRQARIHNATMSPAPRTAGRYSDEPPGDPIIRNGAMWNGSRWIHAPGQSTRSDDSESWNKIDDEIRAATGSPISEWLASTNHRFVNEKGKGDNSGQYFVADYKDGSNKRTLRSARSIYDSILHRAMRPEGRVQQPMATAPQPSPTPHLDGQTAPATSPNDPYEAARQAIRNGKDPIAVKKRLAEHGLNPDLL